MMAEFSLQPQAEEAHLALGFVVLLCFLLGGEVVVSFVGVFGVGFFLIQPLNFLGKN